MDWGKDRENIFAVRRVASMVTATEQLVRKHLLEYIANHGTPVKPDALKQIPVLRDLDIDAILDSLAERRIILRSPSGEVNLVYPVSALPTAHRVSLKDGRRLYAVCALDALGVPFTFNQNAKIESVCSHCQTPVTIEIRNGEIPHLSPATVCLLHADMNRPDYLIGSC